MENEFVEIMSSKTNEELIRLVTLNRDDYQPKALLSAENELKKRNVSDLDIKNVSQSMFFDDKEKNQVIKNTLSSGVRFINFIIDTLVCLFISFILTFPLNANDNGQMLIGYVIIILTFSVYYIFFEFKYQKTLGKFITKTKVVKYNEGKPDMTDILIRTIVRLIPFDNISFLFTRNGFHDMLSKTKVIKDL